MANHSSSFTISLTRRMRKRRVVALKSYLMAATILIIIFQIILVEIKIILMICSFSGKTKMAMWSLETVYSMKDVQTLSKVVHPLRKERES